VHHLLREHRALATYFALSGTGVLLQGWFGRIDHSSAPDAYFLYVASNLGSVLAQFGYPFVVESALGLAAQGRAWTPARELACRRARRGLGVPAEWE
jgi:hypothetical protein